MAARVATVAFAGIDVLDIDAQVQIGAGLPAFTIVGLPDKAVGESRERVRAVMAREMAAGGHSLLVLAPITPASLGA